MHTCPNCGYCPHCGRSDSRPLPMRPAPGRWPYPEFPRPIHIAPYPRWAGIEVGERPDLERGFTSGETTSTVTATVSYL